MAETFVIACPECGKQVKVSDEHVGKRVKCKGCGQIFPVKAPPTAASAPKTKAASGGEGKSKGPPPVQKPDPAAPPPKPTGNEEEFDPNKYTLAPTNDNLPRCPFCANELESLDALICLHCGYNTRTRLRPQVKQIYQAGLGETILWLLPGILCVLTIIGMIVWYIIFWTMIDEWMADSVFEDDPGPPKTFLGGLGPGFMRLYQALIIVFLAVPLFRIAFKRLVRDNKPPERRIKEEWV